MNAELRTESKITPGPWEAITARMCEGEYLITRHGNTVAKCPSFGAGTVPEGERAPWHDCKANAVAIAALPELVEALKAITAALTQPVQTSDNDSPSTCYILRCDCQFAVKTASAALEKAGVV